MPFFDHYPYTNMHNVNLDWVLQAVKAWGAMVEQNNQNFLDLNAANEAFKEYVTGYITNLDVQEEINNKLDQMLASGALTQYFAPYIQTDVSEWLEENLTPTSPPVDASLTIAGAAADAKVVGDRFSDTARDIEAVTGVSLNLNDYDTQSYMILNNAWSGPAEYKSKLIPVSDLKNIIGLYADTVNLTYAFLKSNTMVSGEIPDYCDNTSAYTINSGSYEKNVSVPNDCNYLYVYTGRDNINIGKIRVVVPSDLIIDVHDLKIEKAPMALIRNNVEIDLSLFEQLPYNLESGVWSAVSGYKCILIPSEYLAATLSLYADTYKLSYAFLKSDTITPGSAPDLCSGEIVNTIAVGNSKVNVTIPDDCNFLYVYMSSNSLAIGKVHVMNDSLIDSFSGGSAGGAVYINDIDQILRSLKRNYDSFNISGLFTGQNVTDNLLLLAHTSDYHNDTSAYTRFNDFLSDNSIINAGIVSGDLVDNGQQQNFANMLACEDENVTLIKAVGNHEKEQSSSSAYIYTNLGLNTNTGKNYYYVDFATQKIRVIVLYQYDVDEGTEAIKTRSAHYSQEQINWLLTTLQNAKTNSYSVIIVYHTCNEVGLPIYNNKGFCQSVLSNMAASPFGTIISDIVNAFKHGETLTQSYTATDNGTVLQVNATFSGNGEFICYICGHVHIDFIGYNTKYPDQLICMVQASVINSAVRPENVAHWQSAYDTPRIENTYTENSINVYGIDTNNKLLKVAKIGSSITDKFVPRSFATFKY